jgi:hypothetical protein
MEHGLGRADPQMNLAERVGRRVWKDKYFCGRDVGMKMDVHGGVKGTGNQDGNGGVPAGCALLISPFFPKLHPLFPLKLFSADTSLYLWCSYSFVALFFFSVLLCMGWLDCGTGKGERSAPIVIHEMGPETTEDGLGETGSF